jgi:hypothetical protein
MWLLNLCRFALRALVILAIAGLVALFIEPHWDRDSRTLALRLRRAPEAARMAVVWAERWVAPRERDRPRAKVPDVAAGRSSPSADRLSDEDRARLQRLLEEKLRD